MKQILRGLINFIMIFIVLGYYIMLDTLSSAEKFLLMKVYVGVKEQFPDWLLPLKASLAGCEDSEVPCN